MSSHKKLTGKGDGRKKYVKKALKLSNQLKELNDKTHLGTTLDIQAPQGGNATRVEDIAGNFPRDYVSRDPYDDVIRIKNAMALGYKQTRPVPVTEKEVEAALRKEQQWEEMKLEEFFMTQWGDKIVPSDPANLRWAQEVMPDIYKERMKKIEEQAEIQKRLAALKLMGAKSHDDILFLNAIHRKLVNVHDGPLYALKGDLKAPTFERGWMNPLRKTISDKQAPADSIFPNYVKPTAGVLTNFGKHDKEYPGAV